MLKRLKYFFTRHLIAFSVSIVVLITMINISDGQFFLVTIPWILSYWGTVQLGHFFQNKREAEAAGLSRVEYQEIRRHLTEARRKKRQLMFAYRNIRSNYSFQRMNEIVQLTERIIQNVEKDPQKFYYVDTFFYAHLDTAVSIMTTYADLSAEPVRDAHMQIALQEARDKLMDVTALLETDLKRVRATDVERLKLDLDYLDVSLKKRKLLENTKGDDRSDK